MSTAYGNGLALAVLVYATANVSGGHLNPAVTLGTMLSGHMAPRTGLAYMAAQFLGGVVGEWLGGWRAAAGAALLSGEERCCSSSPVACRDLLEQAGPSTHLP